MGVPEVRFGYQELGAFFEAESSRSGDFDVDVLWERLHQRLASATSDCFQGSHAPDGTPWQPLAKPRAGRQPLIRTGALLEASVKSAWHLVREQNALHYDSGVLPHYWKYQQFGTRTIPARAFLGLPFDLAQEARVAGQRPLQAAAQVAEPSVLERIGFTAQAVLKELLGASPSSSWRLSWR